MKRILTLLLLTSAASWAGQTVIQGVLADPLGNTGTPAGANCTIVISGPSRIGTTGSGTDFAAVVGNVDVTAGAYSFSLAANDGLVPAGTSYAAQYNCWHGSKYNAITFRETWIVPSSSGAVTIGSLRVNVVPTPLVMFQPRQIIATGLASGTYCLNVVNGVVAGLVACGGGQTLFDSGSGLFDSATGLFDAH